MATDKGEQGLERGEQGLELAERVIDLRKQLHEAETEYYAFVGVTPSAARTVTARSGNAKPKHARVAKSREGVKRDVVKFQRLTRRERRKPQSGLSLALRRVLRTDQERDFTIDEMMTGANIDQTRRPSVHAALSRMVAANKIAKGSKAGTYRAVRKEQRG
jgi:hypothetical protein